MPFTQTYLPAAVLGLAIMPLCNALAEESSKSAYTPDTFKILKRESKGDPIRRDQKVCVGWAKSSEDPAMDEAALGLLERELKSQGLNVVTEGCETKLTFNFLNSLAVHKGQKTTLLTRPVLAKWAEYSDKAEAEIHTEQVSGTTSRNVTFSPDLSNLNRKISIGGHLMNMAVATNLLESVFDVLGAKASLNTALTGDARGACLFNCSTWDFWDYYTKWMVQITDSSSTRVNEVSVHIFAKDPRVDQAYLLTWSDFFANLLATAKVSNESFISSIPPMPAQKTSGNEVVSEK